MFKSIGSSSQVPSHAVDVALERALQTHYKLLEYLMNLLELFTCTIQAVCFCRYIYLLGLQACIR